jgi:hypothetical protein
MIMDPGILVPPKGYGGHERLVYMFAKEYARLGHEVHLLVTKGSVVEGCTVHPFGKKVSLPKNGMQGWRFQPHGDFCGSIVTI